MSKILDLRQKRSDVWDNANGYPEPKDVVPDHEKDSQG